MNYKVRIAYLDGKDTSIMIPESAFGSFMRHITTNQVWFDEEIGAGFWTPKELIRYVQTSAEYTKEELDKKKEREIEELKAELEGQML